MNLYSEFKSWLEKVLEVENLVLEKPRLREHGHFATPLALALSKKEGKNPREVAQDLVSKLDGQKFKDHEVEIDIAGPGFINFRFSKDFLVNEAKNGFFDKSEIENIGKGKKIMVEFAHPNTHKFIHVGHTRTMTLGECVSRMLEFSGHEVIRANYEGDVGPHVAKCVWGFINLYDKKVPEEYIGKEAYFLGKIYAEAHAKYESEEDTKAEIQNYNKIIYEQSDPEIIKVWEQTRKWSLDLFESIYKIMNTRFDRYYFESEVHEHGIEIARDLLSKGIMEESEDAIVYKGEKVGLHTRVFVTNKGTATYEAKDLGLVHKQLEEYDPDRIIHVVAVEQKEYFKVIFSVMKEINPVFFEKNFHLSYEMIDLKDGKMSSRKGNVISFDDVITTLSDKIKEKAPELGEDTVTKLAVSSLKFTLLSREIGTRVEFDWDEMTSFEGKTGPYIEYSYARINSIFEKVEDVDSKINIDNLKYLEEDIELEILSKLYEFSFEVANSIEKLDPQSLSNYLFELAQLFNRFYGEVNVIKSDEDKLKARLTLLNEVKSMIKLGLGLLGISTVEKM